MSGIEVVASIIGVAGAGFQISLILNAVSCEINNAPAEIHTISKTVTLFSLLLKQTAAVLDQPNSVHSPEAIRVAEQILEESNAVFAEINAMLERLRPKRQDGSVSTSIPQRIKWCFKKHSVEYLLARMDRLQMSLSLMLQIIQLGSTMASTSRHDSPVKVKEMSDKIRRERVEAQNVVVTYFFGTQQLDRLYRIAKEEEGEPQSPLEYHRDESDSLTLVSTNDSQLTKIEEVVVNSTKDWTIQPPKKVVPEFDDNWYQITESKEQMLRISEQVLDKLLERWTIWREKRDQELRPSRSKRNERYKPVVDDVYDDDENSPFFDRFQDREDSPNARLLEGNTSDWRQPHSMQARLERKRLRKSYAGYQASVSAASSDLEDSLSSSGSKKPPSRRHVIDSDPESSQSEGEQVAQQQPPKPPQPRRRSSAVTIPSSEKPRALDGPPVSKSFSINSSSPAARSGPSNVRPPMTQPTWPQPQQQQPQPRPQLSLPQHHMNQQRFQRPTPAPEQSIHHHSLSSPINGIPTHYNAAYPPSYMPPPLSPTSYLPPSQQMYPFPSSQGQTSVPPPRYAPPRLSPQNSQLGPNQQRPKSRDGKPPRSPSRLSREYQRDVEHRWRQEEEEERRRLKREKKNKISDGAVKGLLAGGGLAVFLEALDALDL